MIVNYIRILFKYSGNVNKKVSGVNFWADRRILSFEILKFPIRFIQTDFKTFAQRNSAWVAEQRLENFGIGFYSKYLLLATYYRLIAYDIFSKYIFCVNIL